MKTLLQTMIVLLLLLSVPSMAFAEASIVNAHTQTTHTMTAQMLDDEYEKHFADVGFVGYCGIATIFKIVVTTVIAICEIIDTIEK